MVKKQSRLQDGKSLCQAVNLHRLKSDEMSTGKLENYTTPRLRGFAGNPSSFYCPIRTKLSLVTDLL